MKFFVTHTIEAENKIAAIMYLKQTFKEGKTYDIQELPMYIQNYKTFIKMDRKFKEITEHEQVSEINISKNIIVLKMIDGSKFKDSKNIKVFHNKVIFENTSLSYFINFVHKILFTKNKSDGKRGKNNWPNC